MTKVFIVGSAGTTGLRLRQRLGAMADVELLESDEAKRKDPDEQKRLFKLADFVFRLVGEAGDDGAAMNQRGEAPWAPRDRRPNAPPPRASMTA